MRNQHSDKFIKFQERRNQEQAVEYVGKLDLFTLKQCKLFFDVHSDHSSQCNGYRTLLEIIEQVEEAKEIEDFNKQGNRIIKSENK